MEKLKIYLSGGMTGYKDFNYPKFNRIAKQLRAKGFNVVNPANDVNPILSNGKEITINELHNLMKSGKINQEESWKSFLRGDIIALQFCNAVYRLKNWQNSKGARYEVNCAKRMKYDFFDEGKGTDLLK